MQTRLAAAGLLTATALLLTACQDQPQQPTVTPSAEPMAVSTPAPALDTVEPPLIATATDVAEAPDLTTAERVPSVLRRTPTSEPPARPVQQQVTATFPPRVTVSELKEMVDQGKAVIVDVRDRVSFANEHIPGSINIPFQETASRIGELPRDKMIVTYCA